MTHLHDIVFEAPDSKTSQGPFPERGAHLASISPFQYDPLDLSSQMFRLLKVHPQRPDRHIEVTMWHSDMHTEYRCLSYVWGKSNDCQPITLNGQLFNVRQNLHDFLDHASQSAISGPIWIDAVCIDQANVAERGHQVQRMGDIYSRAQEVMIWLGKHIKIRETGEWIRSPQYCNILNPFSEQVEDQLNAICSHTCWSRAWIAQEILLQSNVSIVHPDANLP
ncbi:heterokaryon incompatibility protein-domain-containing protein [Paraphoma chrysanthemicola]|uniref:Heterokaryon incompatibility protein-domain-containing protein n=1 Tax=Paraphoma chrysanthemicola TaxID=798071 RepID=A0A8K0R6S0_9PLEO|nr:heterokaryon incompatibility protein-domain-containing protein [Paraphoma chrysanthemicola]